MFECIYLDFVVCHPEKAFKDETEITAINYTESEETSSI
jgi:hypothetical protein